ncbi:hypothetical protein [Thermanaeromonas sp.]|nr:hypothetical protein [Thermanaeromonas sp.]
MKKAYLILFLLLWLALGLAVTTINNLSIDNAHTVSEQITPTQH